MEKTTPSSNRPTSDYVKLSYRATPEKPGLYGGMRPGDGASSSDGSRSGNDKTVELMQRMMDMMQKMETKLEQADRDKREMEKD